MVGEVRLRRPPEALRCWLANFSSCGSGRVLVAGFQRRDALEEFIQFCGGVKLIGGKLGYGFLHMFQVCF